MTVSHDVDAAPSLAPQYITNHPAVKALTAGLRGVDRSLWGALGVAVSRNSLPDPVSLALLLAEEGRCHSKFDLPTLGKDTSLNSLDESLSSDSDTSSSSLLDLYTDSDQDHSDTSTDLSLSENEEPYGEDDHPSLAEGTEQSEEDDHPSLSENEEPHEEDDHPSLAESAEPYEEDDHPSLAESAEPYEEDDHPSLSEKEELHRQDDQQSKSAQRHERLADRAFSICLVHDFTSQWMTRYQEEQERTAIARRHILRQRTFNTWRRQHEHDMAKVGTFAIKAALQDMREAAYWCTIGNQTADQLHHLGQTEDCVQQWFAQYLQSMAEDLDTCRTREECRGKWGDETYDAIDRNLDGMQYYALKTYQQCLGHWWSLCEFTEESRLEPEGSLWPQAALQESQLEGSFYPHAALPESQLESSFCPEPALPGSQLEDSFYPQVALPESQLEGSFHSQSALHESQLEDASRADAFWLQTTVTFWRYGRGMRVGLKARFKALLRESVTTWGHHVVLAQYQRYNRRRTAIQTLLEWKETAQRNAATTIRLDDYAQRAAAWDALDAWQEEVSDPEARLPRLNERALPGLRRQRSYAAWDALDIWQDELHDPEARLARLKERKLEALREQAQIWSSETDRKIKTFAEWDDNASVTDYVSVTTDTIENWSKEFIKSYRTRITRHYHSFRRHEKQKLSWEILAEWQTNQRALYEQCLRADDLHDGYTIRYYDDKIVQWLKLARRTALVKRLACQKEVDFHLEWMELEKAELDDYFLEATELHEGELIKYEIKVWESKAVQLQSKGFAASALLESYGRKTCMHAIQNWRGIVAAEYVPEPPLQTPKDRAKVYMDSRMKTASRRVLRRAAVGWKEWDKERDHDDGMALSWARVEVPSSPAVSELGPMSVFDEEEPSARSPTRRISILRPLREED